MTSNFDNAIKFIDEANAQDPNMVDSADGPKPVELVYSERMSETLARVYPQAGEELQLAVRAQHLKRWTLPRSDFPMDRKGYHAWRNTAKRMHGELAADILSRAGYEGEQVERVQALIRKERAKRDPEAQAVEDVACLVFLEHYFGAFAAKHEEEKIISIVRKTWAKMSETAHEAAMKLPLDAPMRSLVERALAE